MMKRARTCAVAGAKGGVGKTTTSINLGASFAARGESVVVVEMDLAMANAVDFVDLGVDLERVATMHDVLAGDAAVDEALRSASGGIDVLPSGVDLDGFADVDLARLDGVIEELTDRYDVVVVDTGAGVSQETVQPLRIADRVILVSTPRVAAVRDTEKTRQLAEQVGTPVTGVVFTMSGTGKAPPPPELASFLGVELLGHVPEDEAVPSSQDVGEPVVTNVPASPAARAYRDIATRSLESIREGVAADAANSTGGSVETERRQAAVRGIVSSGDPTAETVRRPDDDSTTGDHRSLSERVKSFFGLR